MRSNLFRVRGHGDVTLYRVAFTSRPKTIEEREALLERSLPNETLGFDGDSLLVSTSRALSVSTDDLRVTVDSHRIDVFENSQALALALRPHLPRILRNLFAPSGVETGDSGPGGTATIFVPTLAQQPFTAADGTQCVSVNPGHTLLLQPSPVMEYLRAKGVKPTDPLSMGAALRGIRVSFVDAIQRRGTRLIHSIARKTCGDVRFQDETGREVTLVQHWHERYAVTVNPAHFAVCTSANEPIFYPLEALRIAPKQRAASSDPVVAEALLKANSMSPFQRDRATNPVLSPVAKECGLSLDKSPVEAQGRVLEPPRIDFRDGVETVEPVWNMLGKHVLEASRDPIPWVVLNLTKDNKIVGALEQAFPPIFRNHGVPLIPKCAREYLKVPGCTPANNMLVFVVLPDRDSSRYNQVKDHLRRWVSQCMRIQSLLGKGKISPSYAANIAISVNAKLGFGNWKLILPREIFCGDSPTQIFGFDITHAPPGSMQPSTAAIVGSVNPTGVQWASRFRTLPSRQEELGADHFRALVAPFVRRWQGPPPARILFLRDGVAANQYQYVAREELAILRELYPHSAVAFLVVTKRHGVRLVEKTSHGDLCNLPPSTVVSDKRVTPMLTLQGNPVESFYLHAHTGRLGTSKTVLCSVLSNDPGTRWSVDQLQQLLNGLARAHQSTTQSISLPAPVQAAHLVADKMRGVDSTVHEKLLESLFNSNGQYWL